jgi:hypothetical protein
LWIAQVLQLGPSRGNGFGHQVLGVRRVARQPQRGAIQPVHETKDFRLEEPVAI